MTSNTINIKPERFEQSIGEGVIAGWRWRNAKKSPLLFCHATGFCASAYKQMLQHLCEHFDVFAIDMRGHGRTNLPADPARLQSWQIYADDIQQFLDTQHRSGWTLTGHSMGAVTATKAALGRADVAALKLIEPVAVPPFFTWIAKTPLWSLIGPRLPMVRQAERRRAAWADRENAEKVYARKPAFRKWVDDVLRDYLEDGLIEADGAFQLACDPAWEAATFAAQANRFWSALADIAVPISVFAAKAPSTTVYPGARRRFTQLGAALHLERGIGHLAPMENPALIAGYIATEPHWGRKA